MAQGLRTSPPTVVRPTSRWEQRLSRARELTRRDSENSPLAFYCVVLEEQQGLSRSLDWSGLAGDLAADIDLIRRASRPLLLTMSKIGPAPLAAQARAYLANDGVLSSDLHTYWSSSATSADGHFFAKAILQAYAETLATRGAALRRRLNGAPLERRCPACGGLPQVSILDRRDGRSRQLQCARCLGVWDFRRVVCASCGEEDEHQLACMSADPFAHVRLDMCRTCQRYIKSIDLERLGLAVPLVDEVDGAALDLWAQDRGYRKIEVNLAGV